MYVFTEVRLAMAIRESTSSVRWCMERGQAELGREFNYSIVYSGCEQTARILAAGFYVAAWVIRFLLGIFLLFSSDRFRLERGDVCAPAIL